MSLLLASAGAAGGRRSMRQASGILQGSEAARSSSVLAIELVLRTGFIDVTTFLDIAAVNRLFAQRMLAQQRTWRDVLQACCASSAPTRALYVGGLMRQRREFATQSIILCVQNHLLDGAVSFGALRQAVLEQLLTEQQAAKWQAAAGRGRVKEKVFSFAVGVRTRPFALECMKVVDGSNVVTISPAMLQSMYKHVLSGLPASKTAARRSRLQGAHRSEHATRKGIRKSASSSLASTPRQASRGAASRVAQPSRAGGSRVSKSLPSPETIAGQSADDVRAHELAKRLNINTIVTDVNKAKHSITVQQAGAAPVKMAFPAGGVFDGNADQDEVFRRFALPLLEQVHAGSNSCLMCYGQTGSGKTHSMTGSVEAVEAYAELLASCEVSRLESELAAAARHGPEHTSRHTALGALPPPPAECGILPQALYTVFKWKYSLGHLQTYSVRIGSTEIGPDTTPDRVKQPGRIPITTLALGMATLVRDLKSRKTASTRMNAESSRSHFFVSLEIEQELLRYDPSSGQRSRTGDSIRASAHFVDLAGSERMSTAHGDAPIRVLGGDSEKQLLQGTTARGAAVESSMIRKKAFHESSRFTEMTRINTGLSTLGRVVRALASGAAHVPYKDSALTEALYPVFRGNCRTALLVNISQHPADGAESLASLRFGESMACIKVRVKQQFQSADEREGITRYHHLLASDAAAKYLSLRRAAIQQHLRRLEAEELYTGRVLTEAQQAEAFRQAVREGAIPPELNSNEVRQWVEFAATDRRFRRDMTPAQKLAVEHFKHAHALMDQAGSTYGQALARTEIHPTPEEAKAMRSGTLSKLLLKRPVSVDTHSLRSSAEPPSRVLTHAKTHVTRPQRRAGRQAAAGGAADAASSAARLPRVGSSPAVRSHQKSGAAMPPRKGSQPAPAHERSAPPGRTSSAASASAGAGRTATRSKKPGTASDAVQAGASRRSWRSSRLDEIRARSSK